MDPTPDLDGLVWLFESEPTPVYEGDDWRRYWPYSAIRFTTDVGDERTTLDLEPGAESVHIRMERGGETVVDLDLRQVGSLEVERMHDKDALRLHFRRPEVDTLHVQLRPAFELAWRVGTIL